VAPTPLSRFNFDFILNRRRRSGFYRRAWCFGRNAKEFAMPDRDLTPFVGAHGLWTPDRARRSPGEGRSFAPSARWPTLDLSETDQAYVVTAELPGVAEGDVELFVRDNTLTLRGVKRDERKEGEGERVYLERSYGRFDRTVPFAAEIDADRAEAHCRNGILTVTLQKNPDAQDKARRIEITHQVS
jgi:HSP20 family molecular chaperone IbpA